VARPGGRGLSWKKFARSRWPDPRTLTCGGTRFAITSERLESGALPEGPVIWICGDCHVGNLGPVGNGRGKIEIQIRDLDQTVIDLDQTVIGNTAHELIRLSLSLASAARGSDLPGVTTVKMLERIMHDYHGAFALDENRDIVEPEPVRRVAKKAATASWKSLAAEDLEDTNPTLPIGKCLWPLSRQEKGAIEKLLADKEMHRLATRLRARDDNEEVKLVDAAYWVKGCSSLGRSRYAVLLHVDGNEEDYCLVDLKVAVKAAAPHATRAKMPSD
jgi:uncharacterized protein (DUF2252 family)